MDQNLIDSTLAQLLVQFKQRILHLLPNLAGALLILIAGVLFAYLLRAIIGRLIKGLERFFTGYRVQEGLQRIGIERPVSDLLGNIVFWSVVFFVLTVATETLGLPVVTTWLSGIAMYLPRILAAVLICLVGLGGGGLLRNLIATAAVTAGISYGDILAKLVHVAVVLITLLVAVEHVGINISILTNVMVLLIGALFAGMALAFGLGARISISNILASFYLQKTYRVGHRVGILGTQGEIIQISPTAVILRTAGGQVHIPASKFSEEASTLLEPEGEE